MPFLPSPSSSSASIATPTLSLSSREQANLYHPRASMVLCKMYQASIWGCCMFPSLRNHLHCMSQKWICTEHRKSWQAQSTYLACWSAQGAGQEACAADRGAACRSCRVRGLAGQLCPAAAQPEDGEILSSRRVKMPTMHVFMEIVCFLDPCRGYRISMWFDRRVDILSFDVLSSLISKCCAHE